MYRKGVCCISLEWTKDSSTMTFKVVLSKSTFCPKTSSRGSNELFCFSVPTILLRVLWILKCTAWLMREYYLCSPSEAKRK